MKTVAFFTIRVLVLSVGSVLLYLSAGFIVSLVMGVIAAFFGGDSAILLVLSVALFGILVASLTYGCFMLYKGSPRRYLLWSVATIGSIVIGLMLWSLTIQSVFLDNQVVFLVISSVIGAVVGLIQWLVFRDIVKYGYIWISAMALCWLFWGYLLFLLMPTLD